jgi:uncharacterized membrane protein
MRGLAALLMLQGHVLDGWVRPQDRTSEWFWLSQFLGGFPAPIFLFLVGISLAMVLDRKRAGGASPAELARNVVRRGGWILLLAYAFRLEQFLVWYPASDWGDVFRVDTLNCIAVSTVFIGLLSIAFKTHRGNVTAMGLATAVFVFVTPWVYPLRANLPAFFLSYLNGNGHPWYFSVFPWAAFTFAGITFGYALLQARARAGEAEFFKGVAVAGVGAYAVGSAMSLFPIFQYGFFDYSLTSPQYFLVRLGWVLLILYGAYTWSTRQASLSWSPLVMLGQASLPVYWAHIEIVYGRPSHDFAQALTLWDAATHLLWLLPLMIGLAAVRDLLRTWKKRDRKAEPVLATSELEARQCAILAFYDRRIGSPRAALWQLSPNLDAGEVLKDSRLQRARLQRFDRWSSGRGLYGDDLRTRFEEF